MEAMSITHWVIILVILAIYVIPVVKIVQKAGYSGWWCILLFIPVVNVVFLWIFAFARWPKLRET
jgi:uncharacterized membrane protein YhaH (DUF805 family)